MIRKSIFPEFSVFLFAFCLLLSFSAESEKINQFIKSDMFAGLRDFENLTSDKEFKFVLDTKENDVDISDFITILNRAKKSQYNNFPLIDVRVKPMIFSNYIPYLCQGAENPFSCEKKTQIKITQAINSLGKELSRDIRYPHNYYHVDTPEGGTPLSEVYEILQSKCPDCQKIRFGKGSQSELNRLIPFLEKQKSSCLKKIAKNMFKQLKSYRLPNSCKKQTSTHPVCKKISEDYNLVLDRLLRLTELVYGKSARLKTEAELCIDCARSSPGESSEGLDKKTIEDIWTQARNCEELKKPGQKKRVSSGTGLNKEYTVQMEEDDSYSVILNLQFVAADNYEGDAKREEVPSYYRNKVKECLNEKTNKKLLGSNGEKMQIVLQEKSSEEFSCPEPAEIIEIGPPKNLSLSNKYASDILCPSISHEILHQMGLCDEYFNQKRGYVMDTKTGKIIKEVANIYEVDNLSPGQSVFLAYDCRITKSNSLMAHNYERWGNVFHRKTEASLVTSEQFSAILYGDCRNRNQLFNECSKLAYKNSFEDKTCLNKKKKCEGKKVLGD